MRDFIDFRHFVQLKWCNSILRFFQIIRTFYIFVTLQSVDAVWINDQYRLLFYSTPDENGIIVNALLFEISKHYES